MATLRPFRALRPSPADAAIIAAVPYDVVNTDEARALANDNPLSFLRVSRAELELPAGTDPYSTPVYERAVVNFARLRQRMTVEAEPSLYFYRLRMGPHEQTGLAGCWALDEYDHDVIKKHEKTRRDKEDDRTRHMIALKAQTGPVFLTYRAADDINTIATRVMTAPPLIDFQAADHVQHALWKVTNVDCASLVTAFGRIGRLYIADGHHRAASAARARDELRGAGDSSTFLAVAFPHDQVQILSYNRVVKTLEPLTADQFERAVRATFDVSDGPKAPVRRGEISMYFGGKWWTLRSRAASGTDAIRSLDVSVLQEQLLAPILGITDITTDKRIDFVGGARGTGELERIVDTGAAKVAFSMFPVSVADLMAVSDAGAIMPPKSTWFEPKLRDGLLIHLI
ncbi:MAG TPA: DUF1015 family protein [Vicinamibacterales bacterium]|nr:DUF1015 family protein [Vicinamibacterales bacterium]